LEESGKDNLLKRKNVLLHLGIGADLSQDWGDLLADGEGVEVDFENVVKLANLRTGTLQKTLTHGILEKDGTSGGLSHTKKVGESGVLVLLGFINVD
jgi:hypothetical protein